MDSDQGTMDARDRLNDPRTVNMCKVLLAIKYLRNPFLVGIEPKMKQFHDQLLKSPLCGSCSTKRINKKSDWRLNCSECDVWVDAITEQMSPDLPCFWKNTNRENWTTDYWEIAKLFIPMTTKYNTEPSKTDCSKLLQLYKNCRLFSATKDQQQDLQEVISIRNKLSHLIATGLDDAVTEQYFDAMKDLLSATYLPPEEAADAQKKLEELQCPGSFSRDQGETALMRAIKIDNCEDNEEMLNGFEKLKLDKTDGYPKSPRDPGQASGAGAGESTGAIPKRRSRGAAGDPTANARSPRKDGPFMTRLKEKCGKVNDEQVDRYQHVAPRSLKKEKEVRDNQFTYVREIQMNWPFRIPEIQGTRVNAENALARNILHQFYSNEIQNPDKCREQLQKKFPGKKLDYKGSKTKTGNWVVMVTLPITEIGRGERDKGAEENAAEEILEKLKGFL